MTARPANNLFSERAIELAREAISDGGGAFGAVIAIGSRTLAEARNETVARSNPLLHAEIVAIERACAAGHTGELAEATMYCSCEPCPMCLAAMYYAGIKHVVFSATLADARARGSGDPSMTSSDLIRLLALNITLQQSQFRGEAVSVLDDYVRRYGQL